MKAKKITKDTFLSEILEHPGAEKILKRHNLPCLSCPLASTEMHLLKVGQVCELYGINIKAIIKELNEIYKG